MADQDPQRLTTNDARGGHTPRVTRYVLAISLALVIVVFAVIVASNWMR